MKKFSTHHWSIVLGIEEESFSRPALDEGAREEVREAIERARDLCPPERIVLTIEHGRRRLLDPAARLGLVGRIVEQPRPCGTGPGVFYPLSYVSGRDPDAVVAILPPQSAGLPRERLLSRIKDAFTLAESLPGWLVVLGAEPAGPDTGRAWIVPGAPLSEGQASLVDRFWYADRSAQAEALFRAGAFWSTSIVVARAEALWNLAARGRGGLRGDAADQLLAPYRRAGRRLERRSSFDGSAAKGSRRRMTPRTGERI